MCRVWGIILYVLEPKAEISWIFLLLASAAEDINIANSFKCAALTVWNVWVIRDCFDFIDHCCQHKCIEAIILFCTSFPLTVVEINNVWMNELKASYWLTECLLSTQQIQRKHMNTQIVHCRSDPVSEVHAGCIWTCISKYYSLFCILYYSWFRFNLSPVSISSGSAVLSRTCALISLLTAAWRSLLLSRCLLAQIISPCFKNLLIKSVLYL